MLTVLLATYNGGRFLRQQLDSLLAQTFPDWRLLWRDDGSTDETIAILDAFALRLPPRRCTRLGGQERLGAAASFFALLEAAPDGPVAFCDQDDVWLPDKLARGMAALATGVSLYCARQMLVDAALRPLGASRSLPPRGLAGALTQNIATGCTVLLDAAGRQRVRAIPPPPGTMHDWWCYLVVTASGGAVMQDETPVILYRQHAANAVGAPLSSRIRALAALRRGPRQFMDLFRAHVAALATCPQGLTATAASDLRALGRGLAGGPVGRWRTLFLPGLHRRGWAETMLFRMWLLIG